MGESEDGMERLADLGAVNNHTVPGLKRGRTYYFAIVASNDVGEGPSSQVISIGLKAEEEETPGLDAGLTFAVLLVSAAIWVSDRRKRA
jgi:hypothetical protein